MEKEEGGAAEGVWQSSIFSRCSARERVCPSPPRPPKVEDTTPHVCLLPSPALRPCATSAPTSFMLGSEVDAEKKVWFIPGSAAPLLEVT